MKKTWAISLKPDCQSPPRRRGGAVCHRCGVPAPVLYDWFGIWLCPADYAHCGGKILFAAP